MSTLSPLKTRAVTDLQPSGEARSSFLAWRTSLRPHWKVFFEQPAALESTTTAGAWDVLLKGAAV